MVMRIVKFFLDGPFSVMLIAAAMLLGAAALWFTPREEDPQIIVPMADVEVSFPGHSPREVEELVTRPLERILWQLDGVEHVYSSSSRDKSMVTVRFYVGEDRDRAMVRLRDKINENINIIPDGVAAWRIVPVSINDVPIVTMTLTSKTRDGHQLRRYAEELAARMDSIADISGTQIIGGYSRQIRIEPSIESLNARKLTLFDLNQAIANANMAGNAGLIVDGGRELVLMTDPNLPDAKAIENIIVSAQNNKIVRVGDLAQVKDDAAEAENYVRHNGQTAVTIAFSKKAGVNAVTLSQTIVNTAEKLRQSILPADVELTVTRNQGASADLRVDGLVTGMMFAILTVVLLIAMTMGWRESLIVGASVPVSFALALFTNYVFGYTLNRVTLFALILSLGLVVDDPITNVDNIQRHIRMGKKSPFEATLDAVKEVLPPVILSTLAVIVSFTPMFFITGMMGPYMAPMAINVPLTVTFSTVCALTFVPYMAYRMLRKRAGELKAGSDGAPEWVKKLYAKIMMPFLTPRNAWLLIAAVIVLVIASAGLMLFKVPLKMLPFDNRDEFQILLKLPHDATLEDTSRAVAEVEQYLQKQNEVKDFQSYIGIASPIDFNGLVRHYRMRNEPNQADIRVNLFAKSDRAMPSHEFALRVRDSLEKLAKKYGAAINIIEVPPGPPVLATVTVEVYGNGATSYDQLLAAGQTLQQKLQKNDPEHFREIDIMQQISPPRLIYVVNKEKASVNGITAKDITDTLQAAVGGLFAGNLRDEAERQGLNIQIRLPYHDRNAIERLKLLNVKGQNGTVQLGELGNFEKAPAEMPIMHKNLQPVVFVTAESVGRAPGEMILSMIYHTLRLEPVPPNIRLNWAGEGEWEITLRVFRDLGIAFGVALLGILLLLIIQTRNIVISLIMMCAIPLTVIGIAPGFYLLNIFGAGTVENFLSPVFFTATGMIGMIALGGIVIRNSIVLLEFIQESESAGLPTKQAILQSGAVRFRPIMLTAVTTLMGAWPITLDPIFSGLAWALIFGLIASTLFTMVLIPVIYMLFHQNKVGQNEA